MLDHFRRGQLIRKAIRNNPERAIVLDWLLLEWDAYADDKWDDARQDHEDSMLDDGWMHEGFWNRQVNQYLDRSALVSGPILRELPALRQAPLKALAVLFDGLACMIRHTGTPPAPGHPSGDVLEWVSQV